MRGDHPVAHWRDVHPEEVCLLDVREAAEFEAEHVPGAINIPLGELRGRLGDLPSDREIWLYCGIGQRAYYATRALIQRGHRVRNLSGGIQTYHAERVAAGLR